MELKSVEDVLKEFISLKVKHADGMSVKSYVMSAHVRGFAQDQGYILEVSSIKLHQLLVEKLAYDGKSFINVRIHHEGKY